MSLEDDRDAFNDDTFGDTGEFSWETSQAAVVEIERERQRNKTDLHPAHSEEAREAWRRSSDAELNDVSQESPWAHGPHPFASGGVIRNDSLFSYGGGQEQQRSDVKPTVMSVADLEAQMMRQFVLNNNSSASASNVSEGVHGAPPVQFLQHPAQIQAFLQHQQQQQQQQQPQFQGAYRPNMQMANYPMMYRPQQTNANANANANGAHQYRPQPNAAQYRPQHSYPYPPHFPPQFPHQSQQNAQQNAQQKTPNTAGPIFAQPHQYPPQSQPHPFTGHQSGHQLPHQSPHQLPHQSPHQYQRHPAADLPNWRSKYRSRWRWMMPADIDFVLRHQMLALQNTTDYYRTALMAKRGKLPALSAPTHPTLLRPANPSLADALEGSLGRPAPKCIKTPKPRLTQVADDPESHSAAMNHSEENQKMIDDFYPDAPSTMPRDVRLAIENGMRVLMQIQDICVAPSPLVDSQAEMSKLVDNLVVLIQLRDPAGPPRTLDLSRPPELREHEFFVNLVLVPKGAKLLMRIIPVLSPEQLSVLVRGMSANLGALAALADARRDPTPPEVIIQILCKALYEMPLGMVMEALSALLGFFAEASIGILLGTKCGALGIATFLHRVEDERLRNPSLAETPAYLSWLQLVDHITGKLQAACRALLDPGTDSGSGHFAIIRDLVIQMSAHASPPCAAALRAEIRSLDPSIPVVQQLLKDIA